MKIEENTEASLKITETAKNFYDCAGHVTGWNFLANRLDNPVGEFSWLGLVSESYYSIFLFGRSDAHIKSLIACFYYHQGSIGRNAA